VVIVLVVSTDPAHLLSDVLHDILGGGIFSCQLPFLRELSLERKRVTAKGTAKDAAKAAFSCCDQTATISAISSQKPHAANIEGI